MYSKMFIFYNFILLVDICNSRSLQSSWEWVHVDTTVPFFFLSPFPSFPSPLLLRFPSPFVHLWLSHTVFALVGVIRFLHMVHLYSYSSCPPHLCPCSLGLLPYCRRAIPRPFLPILHHFVCVSCFIQMRVPYGI